MGVVLRVILCIRCHFYSPQRLRTSPGCCGKARQSDRAVWRLTSIRRGDSEGQAPAVSSHRQPA